HGGRQHVAQLDRLAGLDELRRLQDRLLTHVVAGAALVAGAPLRRAAVDVHGRLPRLRVSQRARSEPERQGNSDDSRAHGGLLVTSAGYNARETMRQPRAVVRVLDFASP